jgi:plasmid maintenance system antidote protein VapI
MTANAPAHDAAAIAEIAAEDGRVPLAPGSREPSPDGLGPSGFDPSRCLHPSTFIQEELDTRGWNRARLAFAMGDDPAINLFVLDMYFDLGPERSRLRLGEFTAKQLGRAFGTSWQLWLGLETAWLRDSDGSGEAGETRSGSTEGDSAGPQDIAQASSSAHISQAKGE